MVVSPLYALLSYISSADRGQFLYEQDFKSSLRVLHPTLPAEMAIYETYGRE
jgi:hypothetical protein